MTAHPYHDVTIAGVYNTPQARRLPEHSSTSIALAGAVGALVDAGLTPGGRRRRRGTGQR